MDLKDTVVSVCSGGSEYSLVDVTVNFMGFLDLTSNWVGEQISGDIREE